MNIGFSDIWKLLARLDQNNPPNRLSQELIERKINSADAKMNQVKVHFNSTLDALEEVVSNARSSEVEGQLIKLRSCIELICAEVDLTADGINLLLLEDTDTPPVYLETITEEEWQAQQLKLVKDKTDKPGDEENDSN